MHPPLGKWLIALGEWMFGLNSFGWRFMPLVFGTALVFVTIRLARRLSRSTLVGGLAGLLLAVDGLAFTMSRIALIDIFAAFFVVAAVSALAADRDWFRTRLADHLVRSGRPDLGGAFGPVVWWRPWRWVAGLMFGAAVSVKWNALFFLAVFGLLAVWWDVSARRLAPDALPPRNRRRDPAFFAMVAVAACPPVQLAGMVPHRRVGRQWGVDAPSTCRETPRPHLAAWLHYQKEIYDFHTGDASERDPPLFGVPERLVSWPASRVDGERHRPRTDGCLGPDNCIRVISGMGTPYSGGPRRRPRGGLVWLVRRAWPCLPPWRRDGCPVPASERPIFFFTPSCWSRSRS